MAFTGNTSGQPRSSQSNASSHDAGQRTIRALYRHLEVEIYTPESLVLSPAYELGQLRNVQTFIGKGWDKGLSDDRIYITHEIYKQ